MKDTRRGVLLYYFYPSVVVSRGEDEVGEDGDEEEEVVVKEVRFSAGEREEVARFIETSLARPRSKMVVADAPLSSSYSTAGHDDDDDDDDDDIDNDGNFSGRVVGRVRVAFDGVNATVGGPLDVLEAHADDLRAHPLLRTLGVEKIDFKLQAYPVEEDDDDETCARIRYETGFDRLSVRRVQEVVSLGVELAGAPPPMRAAGRHMDPEEWHEALSQSRDGDVLLLDARNYYERRIGGFDPPHVESLDVKLRAFSELPRALREAMPTLRATGSRRKKKVLMYCTGGVRCERASAYLNTLVTSPQTVSDDADDDDQHASIEVCQLRGGIQRYLETFPDGGFFKGKNFVFDDRIAVGPDYAQDAMLGSCLVCGTACDDYRPRRRCVYCRMLVLVCRECIDNGTADGERQLCELCVLHGRGGQSAA